MEPFTAEWGEALCREVNRSAAYAAAAREWRWALVFHLEGADERRVLVDLYEGACRGVRAVEQAEADGAPYEISADRATWDAALAGALDPMSAVLSRRVRLRGDLMTVMRFVPAARELLECAKRASAG